MLTKKYINQLSYQIVGCAIEVHKHLGPGLLESVYEQCLIHELKAAGLQVKSQQSVPVTYKGIELNCELRYDILVEDAVIVELKAVILMPSIFEAQLLTYLKLLNKPKGLLINFNTHNITETLVPLVTPLFASLPEY